MPQVQFQLPDNDWGQLLDGLDVLIEQWESTAQCLRTGEIHPDVVIRECHDPEEAEAIAARYRSISKRLYAQRSVVRAETET